MKKNKRIISSISLSLILILTASGCSNKTKAVKIDTVNVTAYKNYDFTELMNELNNPDNNTYLDNNTQLTEDLGPFYKFWISGVPNLDINDFSNGEVSYLVKDLGEYPDHWIYFSNPFGTSSYECIMCFYQDDLTNEEVEKALQSLQISYLYKNKDDKNCSCDFTIDPNCEITYYDYNSL